MKVSYKLSLRELLAIVMFAVLALASLRAGGILASIMICLCVLFATCMIIVALVARDRVQALAIGFSVPIVVYGGAVLAAGNTEFDPFHAKLPTSHLLRPVFQAIVKPTWTNFFTGEVVPDYDPAKDPNSSGAGGTFPSSPMTLLESPDRRTFMAVGHTIFAMLFGYAGGKFAVAVYRRQRSS